MEPKSSLLELLKAGVHFGHQTSRWHPSMEPFIFGAKNGVHVIDLEKTHEKLTQALAFIQEEIKKGGKILLVGTKRQARATIKAIAEKTGMPYVVERWLGGTFTNFESVKKQVRKLEELTEEQADAKELKKYTKKERLVRQRKLEKLRRDFHGLLPMRTLPAAVFIVGVKDEKIAVAEARKKHVPIVALCDTNSDIRGIERVIPGNDDAVKSIELFGNEILQAIREGQAQAAAVASAAKPELKQ